MTSVLAKTANKGAGASVSGNNSYFDKYIYQTNSKISNQFKSISSNYSLQAFKKKTGGGTTQKFASFGEVNDILKRIQETKNVIGTMVIIMMGLQSKARWTAQ